MTDNLSLPFDSSFGAMAFGKYIMSIGHANEP